MFYQNTYRDALTKAAERMREVADDLAEFHFPKKATAPKFNLATLSLKEIDRVVDEMPMDSSNPGNIDYIYMLMAASRGQAERKKIRDLKKLLDDRKDRSNR